MAAALLTVAAAGSLVLVARQWVEPAPVASSKQVCQAVAELQDALDLSSLGDQAVVRARASRTADLLANPAAKEQLKDSVAVARGVVAVLEDPGSTVSDLTGAIAPIARQCSS